MEEENHSFYENLESDATENDITTVNSEIDGIINDTNRLEFITKVKSAEETRSLDQTTIEFNFNSHYKIAPIEKFEINFGSDDLPRFSCANHKLNIAVRGAISIHRELTQILKDLNKTNAHIRRSIQLNYAFNLEKCKLRLENLTRWSSAYLMLLSVKKAYDKKMFNADNPCSVSLETVEIYIQILQPAYILSLQLQLNHSTIADVIPSVKQLINTYIQMELPETKRELCNYLVTALREKFYYELNSETYKVIGIFNLKFIN